MRQNHEEGFDDWLLSRSKELQESGMEASQAFSLAILEHRIRDWSQRDEHWEVSIYGDWEAPAEDVKIEPLGITVHPENHASEKSVMQGARTVLRATVRVNEWTVRGITEASWRVSTLVGIWTLMNMGNSGIGWWSYLTHGLGSSGSVAFDHPNLVDATALVTGLEPKIRRNVDWALYWIREPSAPLKLSYRSATFRTFSAYWNAFECLVDAVNEIDPPPSVSPSEKERLIDEFVRNHGGKLSVEIVQDCYHEIVNPPLSTRASHALRVSIREDAESYSRECFHRQPPNDRLHVIRNAIHHGNIDAENPEELIRVEGRLTLLRVIVYRMLYWCLSSGQKGTA